MKSRTTSFVGCCLVACAFCALLVSAGCAPEDQAVQAIDYPETPQKPETRDYHGTSITDNYSWLGDAEDPEVVAWTEAQERVTRSITDPLPQRQWLIERFNALWRYDDESVPRRVLDGERIFFWTKMKEDEKWVYCTKAKEEAETIELINPNTWDPTETLAGTTPSRDGTLLAFGKAEGGNEDPVIHVMVVETGEILPDRLRGWKQNVTAWLPDNSGFYYSCKPLEGEVPEGEHEYWHSAWFHRLGTDSSEDVKVFSHDGVKEYWHTVGLSEDGRWLTFRRGLFYKNEIYFKALGDEGDPIPLATGFDADYHTLFIGDDILIKTDSEAPRYRVMKTTVDKPEREHWTEFLPQHEKDPLQSLHGIAGHLYASYSHNAYSLVRIYDIGGSFVRDLDFPTIGSGGVSGHWSQPEVWVGFSSFSYPTTTFKYHFDSNELEVYREFPVEVDVDGVVAEQVWFDSKDGTPVPMFLVHHEDVQLDGNNPVLMYGYGGFKVSRRPRFSTTVVTWLEAGGVWADVCLRGGGEFGRQWHEAGMLEKKQNVFDDFIAAGEWLIDNGWTSPDRLGIGGGSNGGLLVGAVMVQRPELFRTVYCGVPLLDMVNYHELGLANIWAEEYGSSEDPEHFRFLHAYSPYHNVEAGTAYPACVITGSENDARVDPVHTRKMTALLQEADPDGAPHVLFVRKASGHGGGTTISKQIEQQAEIWSFMMDQLGMQAH